MSIFQFLRILAARRWFLLIALISCVSVASVMALILPKKYKASARVMLDIIKPDPVTGEVIANQFLHAYTATQIELIRDHQVTDRVVDQLGWTTSPAIETAYEAATNGKGEDIRHWLGDQIIDSTKADLVENSNILEISYTSHSPAEAKQVVAAIRSAFIDMTLQSRRDTAGKSADWYRDQVNKAKTLVATAETARTDYARANGIVLQSDNVDLENARLQALSTQSAIQASAATNAYTGDTAPAINQAKTQLEQVNQQLTQAATIYGPNHPSFLALKHQANVLEAALARERTTAHSLTSGNAQSAYDAQKSRVVAQRDKIDQLNLMQRDIDVKRQQYMEAAKRAGELRMQADTGEAGLTVLGEAVVPDKAYFPNVPLIIGGSIGFGLALGVVSALMIELMRRRVRSVEDLEYASDVEVFAMIGETKRSTSWPRRIIHKIERRAAIRRLKSAELI